jgi:hypothetical protein
LIVSLGGRQTVRQALVLHLKDVPANELYPLWCETLHVLAAAPRQELLWNIDSLSSVIAALGGPEALSALELAIDEVRRWFP